MSLYVNKKATLLLQHFAIRTGPFIYLNLSIFPSHNDLFNIVLFLPRHGRTEEASSKLAGPTKSYLSADKELLYLLASTPLSRVAMTELTSRSGSIASLSRSCESEW
jgi:hypothetical protein